MSWGWGWGLGSERVTLYFYVTALFFKVDNFINNGNISHIGCDCLNFSLLSQEES